MANIIDRLRDEIELQAKELGRRPEILIVSQPRVQGVCIEAHENGFVIGSARAQALDVVMNTGTHRPEVQVSNVPMNNLSERLYYVSAERIYVSVEQPKKAIIEPAKRLILPG